MSTDFTFPLALCKAQFNIWLHALELFETIASRVLQDGIVLIRAEADVVARAEDWRALAMVPVRALQCPDADGASLMPPATTGAQAGVVEPPPSRRATVNEALRTLHKALAPAPARRLHPGRRAAAVKGKA
ncbi:hypothetical protein J2W30_004637 [Variovorax boronicumulans]|uniref:hypothetical protein n=1 Tax=Variovorax boronicumulans TaxID=436515 RepID=UPI00278620C0|nr:hypothetical protein [Variovorax boronicumulans]MDQ0036862.1 hypothetical protein [Variovorax boronicumulans]